MRVFTNIHKSQIFIERVLVLLWFVPKISFFFLNEIEIQNCGNKLKERLFKCKTVKGTKSFLFFSSSSIEEIATNTHV